jgi:hypothetical protein
MWTMAQSDIDPIAWVTSRLRKTMIMIFFSLNGIVIVDILPEKPS